jgi:hypothetical protein
MTMKLRVLLYCALGGLPALMAAAGGGHFGWWWLSGVILAAAFVPVAVFGPRGIPAQFAVIAAALWIVSVFCTWTEAVLFIPSFREHAARDLGGATMMYLLAAAALAVLAPGLKLTRESGAPLLRRSWGSVLPLILISGVAYTIYYLIFGGITYQFFTKGYYPEATQQVAQLGLWFWAIEIGRGVLMALGVLPLIYTLRMTRWQTAVTAGLVLWIAGGLAPLLAPGVAMGTTQRLIHIIEIFTQNAPLGITAALLLRPRSRPAGDRTPNTATAVL